MQSLRMTLMSGVAAISLAAAPALAQEATSSEAAGGDQMTQAQTERSFDEHYSGEFAAWGDRTVDELLGTTVVNDAGETIGEIDDFGLAEDSLVAIIGVGGFLGMGEHSVAVPIEELSTQGDQLMLSGVTREQLEAMPEYNAEDGETFAAEQTLRSGYEGGATTDTAAMPEADAADGDQPMAEAGEEVAQAAGEGADAMGDASDSLAENGEEVAEAADEAAEPVTQGAGESSEMTDAEAAEPVAKDAEMAEGEAADERMAEETDMAEGEATEEPMAGEEAEMAETDATDEPMAAETEMAGAEGEAGWTEEMDQIFADIADREIAELIGMEVASADGEVVGEIDNFALEGQDVVAIIGVGGFLGIGEHEVALSLGDMTYDGEKLVLSSMTEEQLREMPEYEVNEENRLPQDGTLRSTYNQ